MRCSTHGRSASPELAPKRPDEYHTRIGHKRPVSTILPNTNITKCVAHVVTAAAGGDDDDGECVAHVVIAAAGGDDNDGDIDVNG